ncbi:hypothetical protein CTI14_68920, partial [Methylobacterium radiotolerans]
MRVEDSTKTAATRAHHPHRSRGRALLALSALPAPRSTASVPATRSMRVEDSTKTAATRAHHPHRSRGRALLALSALP